MSIPLVSVTLLDEEGALLPVSFLLEVPPVTTGVSRALYGFLVCKVRRVVHTYK